MIEWIDLLNFQRHRKKRVGLDEFITCLVGDTERGKSSVLRALYWLCFNRPSGDEMVRHGKSKCRVEVSIDGRIIRRIKGSRVNLYRLDGSAFKSFGQTVPEEIAKLLNVSDINFQAQLDSPFWLADPAPKVSRELNAVVNLSVIDDTLSSSGARVRQAKAQLEVCEARLAQAEQSLEALSWVPDFLTAFREAEVLEKRVRQNRIRLTAIASRLDQATGLSQIIRRSSCAKGDGLALKRAGERYFQGRERLDRLTELIEQADKCTAVVQTGVVADDAQRLEKLWKRVAENRAKLGRLDYLVSAADREEMNLCNARGEIKEAREELSGVTECPTCGGPLPSP